MLRVHAQQLGITARRILVLLQLKLDVTDGRENLRRFSAVRNSRSQLLESFFPLAFEVEGDCLGERSSRRIGGNSRSVRTLRGAFLALLRLRIHLLCTPA